jgi:hypothetical protein
MNNGIIDDDIVTQLFCENERLAKELEIEKEVTDLLNKRIDVLEQENRIICIKVFEYFAKIEDSCNVLPVFCRAIHDNYLEDAKSAQPDITNMSTPLDMPLPLDI